MFTNIITPSICQTPDMASLKTIVLISGTPSSEPCSPHQLMTLRCQPRSWLRNGPQFSSTLRKVSHPVGQSFTRSRPVSCRHNPPLVQYSGFSDAYPARRNLRRIHRRHRTIDTFKKPTATSTFSSTMPASSRNSPTLATP